CRTVTPNFEPIASTVIEMNGLDTKYPLPANFRTLISVEYSGDGGRKRWLTRFEMFERARLADPETAGNSTGATSFARIGTNIEFLPRPPAGHRALLWYATNAPQLTGDGQAIDTLDRLVDNYVIFWAAREIAGELGHWERHESLSGKLGALEPEIRVLARTRDLTGPTRIVDVYEADRFGRIRGGRRW
ncbi:MAG: hypothetical protein KIS78_38105, partial [Labilithrix sp.]|nr:hypothetical protein [Labilithrix sp.]